MSKQDLIIANKELASQNAEKEKRAAELIIANKEKEKCDEELNIANIELTGTKKAERIALQKLTESEERYRLLAENLQITNALLRKKEKKLKEAQAIALLGNWEIDLVSNKHFWSDGFYKMFNIRKEEVIPSAEKFLSLIHPDDVKFIAQKIEEGFSTFKDSSFSFRFIRKNHSVQYGYSEYKFEFDKNGKPVRLYGIVQDITERKKTEKEILKKNKQLRNLSNHLQNIREEERMNIAREIHDELGQQLTALKMDIDWILHKQNNPEKEVVAKLQEMLKMNDDIINTVRRISSDLRPALIDNLGLIATIEWKCADFEEKTGVRCQFISAIKERKFNKTFSINVYRILQETLTNVARHAEAKSVTVLLTGNEKELFMEIIDDGRGITKENIRNSKKLGILGMNERVALLEGKINITGTDKGTHVKLILPLKNEYTNS